jgi:hypothetical protein
VISPPTNLPPPQSNTTPLRRAGNIALIATVFVVAYVLHIPVCPFAIVTRHPCPGCGLTRAGVALFTGHFDEAFHLHPLVVPIVPIVAVVVLQGTYNYVRHGRWYTFAFLQHRVVTIGAILLGAVMFAVWIARFFGAFGGPVAV